MGDHRLKRARAAACDRTPAVRTATGGGRGGRGDPISARRGMAVCPVCLEKPRRRARLGCGHPLCAECARELLQRAAAGGVFDAQAARCPLCRGAVAADAVDGYYRRVALSYNCAVHPLWLERRGSGVEVLGLSERALVRTRGDLARLRQLFAGPSVLMELGGAAVRRSSR